MPGSEQISLMDYALQEVEVRLKLEEGKTLYSTNPISSSDRAAEVMADVMKELDRETVCIVNLDNKLRPINYNVVSVGGLSSSIVPVQNAFKSSILSNSYGVVLLHNHPSGVVAPSAEDCEVTRKMISAGKILDTPVLDHCIIGGGTGEIYSFRREMPELWSREPNLDEVLRAGKGKKVREGPSRYEPELRIRSFEAFQEYAESHIRDYLPEGSWKTEIQRVEKTGESYTALIARQEGQRAVPAINLDRAFREHQSGIPMHRLMREMADAAQVRVPFGDLSWTADYGKAREQLFIRVSSADRNPRIQNEVPCTRMEDLLITYHLRIPGNEALNSSITVSNEMLNRYGILKETLHADAMENSMRILPPVIRPLDSVMQDIAPGMATPERSGPPEIMLVSNREMTYGAAAMFYPGVMEEVSREMGGNLFILPSSTEEVLVVRAEDPAEYRDLETMVRQINASEVQPSERLSDHVYHFDAESRSFERADAYCSRQLERQDRLRQEPETRKAPARKRGMER